MCRKLIYLFPFILALCVAGNASANLVAHWTFDDGSGTIAQDSSVNGYDGTLHGGPQWVAGQIGGALELDGTNDYVELPIGPLLSSLTNSTFAIWVDFSNEGGGWQRIFDFGSGEAINMFLTPRTDTTGPMRFAITENGWANEDQTTAQATLPSGWHQVTLTINADKNIHSLYLDGELVAENTASRYTPSTLGETTQNWLGRSQYGADAYFDGRVDDFSIYNRALVPAQIMDLFNGIPPEFTKAFSPIPAEGTIHLETWVNLSWSPGDFAVSHDVYFGENFDNVNNGAEGTFQGNQPSTFFVVGFPGFPYPAGLVPGTTYYWRIDEIEADGTTVHKGDVWSFTVPPRKAYNPIPADGAKFINTDVILNWTAGFGTKLHTVYFGDNFDDVNNAAGGLPQGTKSYTPSSLELNKTYYWRVDEFDAVSTYKGDVWSFRTIPIITITDPNLVSWWKFDEGSGTNALDWSGHNNHSAVMGNPQWVAGYDGEALEFDGADDYVSLPIGSAISALKNSTFTMWVNFSNAGGSWQRIFDFGSSTTVNMFLTPRIGMDGQMRFAITTGGSGAEEQATASDTLTSGWHHVAVMFNSNTRTITLYLDSEVVARRTAATLTPSDLGNTTNNWLGRSQYTADAYFRGSLDDFRIYDYTLSQAEVKETMRGDPLLAWGPIPLNRSTPDIHGATPLSWSQGDKASQHDVYFGTDKDTVDNADTSDTTGIYRGRQGVTSFTPPEGVEWGGGPYYWRIDEYNTDGTISKGRIWTFTVADYFIVDDFEDYDIGNNEIWWAWKDGLGYAAHGNEPAYPGNGTGSMVGDETTGSYMEETIVHGGGKSMPFSYDNNKQGAFKYSEVEKTLSYPRDWTENGVSTLTIWFRGDSANAADTLYVALNGNALVTNDNPAAAQVGIWTEWNIDLQAFADQGVNLANVNTIALGLGNKKNPQAGGSGTMYFDDIRLYRPRNLADE
jgi:hypothetical protein